MILSIEFKLGSEVNSNARYALAHLLVILEVLDAIQWVAFAAVPSADAFQVHLHSLAVTLDFDRSHLYVVNAVSDDSMVVANRLAFGLGHFYSVYDSYSVVRLPDSMLAADTSLEIVDVVVAALDSALDVPDIDFDDLHAAASHLLNSMDLFRLESISICQRAMGRKVMNPVPEIITWILWSCRVASLWELLLLGLVAIRWHCLLLAKCIWHRCCSRANCISNTFVGSGMHVRRWWRRIISLRRHHTAWRWCRRMPRLRL